MVAREYDPRVLAYRFSLGHRPQAVLWGPLLWMCQACSQAVTKPEGILRQVLPGGHGTPLFYFFVSTFLPFYFYLKTSLRPCGTFPRLDSSQDTATQTPAPLSFTWGLNRSLPRVLPLFSQGLPPSKCLHINPVLVSASQRTQVRWIWRLKFCFIISRVLVTTTIPHFL